MKKKTIVVSSHDMILYMKCVITYILKKGHVLSEGKRKLYFSIRKFR